MRNVFMIGLLVFIAVAAGGYAINWYAQANTTKSAIEEYIARLNEKQKYISYSSIETSGFPSKVNVSIVKPRFHGRMDQFLKELRTAPPAQPGQPAPAAPAASDMEPWDEDMLLDGRITFGINAVSDYYTMTISGNWLETSTIGGATMKHITQPTGDISCSLHFQRSTGIFDTLWDYNQLNRDAKALAHDFRAVDCNTLGQTTIDDPSKNVLSSAGLSRIYITNTPQDEGTQMRVYLKLTDMEVTPQGDAMMAPYLHALSPAAAAPYTMSLYGKQNVDIDFTYIGPTDFKSKTGDKQAKEESTNVPIDILLSKFDIHNNLYNYTLSFRFKNAPKGKDRSVTLFVKSEAAFTDRYDTMLYTVARNIIQQVYASDEPKMREARAKLRNYTPDQLYAILYPSIPKLSPLGKMVVGLDGAYTGYENMNSGTYTLNGFEVSMAPYSVTGKGEAKVVPMEMPNGKMDIACSNCLNIIDDLNNYGARLQQTMTYFDQGKAAAIAGYIQHADALKRFLSALAVSGKDAANNPILMFNVTSVNGNTTVNNKNMAQIIGLLNEYMGSAYHAPANTGAAGGNGGNTKGAGW